jgi:FkbM family methyltransferase
MLLFDIGANIGKWALQNYSNDARIICLEASPTTFRTLVDNVKDKNITPLNFAVTSSPTSTVEFFDCSANTISTLNEKWLNDLSSRFYNQYRYKKIVVNTITIDKLIKEYGIPDLLKVDVEGAENIVLQSLTKPVKTICFEWASETYDVTLNSVNHLESLGYTKFHIQNEDSYTYKPSVFDLTKQELLNKLQAKIPKQDWGMIWASFN